MAEHDDLLHGVYVLYIRLGYTQHLVGDELDQLWKHWYHGHVITCHLILRVETNYFFCHLASEFRIQDASSMDCPGWYLRNVRQSIR